MHRFRFTLIAVCLLLLFLGGSDLFLWYNNQTPLSVTIDALEASGAPRDWLHVTDGHQDLDRAISTSGSIELEALLIPLTGAPGQEQIRVLIETRNPHLLELFKKYHFFADTLPDKQAVRAQYAAEFLGQRDITGMLMGGFIAKGNRQKLLELAQQTGLAIDQDVILLSEGKEPERWRGVFFAVVGLLGLVRVLSRKNNLSPPA